jgi:putative acetyltransferase
MITHIRTDATNKDFVKLVRDLDADLAIRDGEDHSFYDQFNKIENLKHVVIIYENGLAVACGALKKYSGEAMEVKRMYTIPKKRGKGFATKILKELEQWAEELAFKKCILETGHMQPEAIACYKKNGYKLIPNYGQYSGVDTSFCFEKEF